MKELPTAEYVRECLDYDPETGMLAWKTRPLSHFRATKNRSASWICRNWNARHQGTTVRCPRNQGYVQVRLDYVLHQAHRLAWLIVTGKWPSAHLDHVNRDRSDNRWANLREATDGENVQNAGVRRDNTTGFVGVYWDRETGGWYSQISVNGKTRSLGHFDLIDDAARARIAAEAELHPFSTRPEVLAYRAANEARKEQQAA